MNFNSRDGKESLSIWSSSLARSKWHAQIIDETGDPQLN
jgi:hypothetical protein